MCLNLSDPDPALVRCRTKTCPAWVQIMTVPSDPSATSCYISLDPQHSSRSYVTHLDSSETFSKSPD